MAIHPVAVEPAIEAAEHDEFGIDLEKELMGEFADFEPEPAAAEQPAAAAPVSQPEDAVDIAIEDDFEDAFTASLEEDVAAATPVAVVEQAPVAASHTAQSYDEASFDDAVASQVETDRRPRSRARPRSRTRPRSELDLAPEFELDDLDLPEMNLDDAPIAAIAPARDAAPEVATADALAEVDMDFTGAFDEAASDDADVGDHETAPPAAEPTYHAAEPAAASADPLELGLEEELNAMLDDAHAEPEPQSPVTFAPQAEPRPAASPVDMRWSALEEDEEETPAPAAAPTSDYRRPFIDPAIVSRLASFRATPASTPAPKIELAPQPEADLDDLLDAMESEVHLDHDAPAAPLQHNGYAAAPAAASHEVAYADDAAPATQGYDSYEEESPADYDPAPDVETIDVPEMAVAVADDLDIPELAYEQDEPAPPAYDDLDADYGRAFVEPAMPEEPASQSQRDVIKHAEDIDFDTDFESLYRLWHGISDGCLHGAAGQRTCGRTYERMPTKATMRAAANSTKTMQRKRTHQPPATASSTSISTATSTKQLRCPPLMQRARPMRRRSAAAC